ncbi:MAG: PEP-CTERM sorting domain-containing protein [Planctomycetes bacterium]|nr:PEP-CTERM sorting domain-containing protein [Planctomycetota bacterium]
MRHLALTLALMACGALAAVAAPINPRIDSHDFNFGAWEPLEAPFYDPRGAEPDTLGLLGHQLDREVTAFWEVWPGGVPLPIYNAADEFGGDLELHLVFDAEDAVPPHLDVSLIGTGAMGGADLIISGKMPDAGIDEYETLVAIDILYAALYGYGGDSSFVLETFGYLTYVNPLLPGGEGLEGQSAVSRGNIDFLELELPSGYHPLADYGLSADGGGYSGEVGRGVPEPASLLMLLCGAGMLVRRR